MPTGEDRTQILIAHASALSRALDACLAELVKLYGNEARRKIERLRDELITQFKQSGISADREMEHAKIVGPAIEILQDHFNAVLRTIP